MNKSEKGAPHGAKAAEVYGIVGYLSSLFSFALWIIWAYTPDWVLRSMGITYYPDRYWAVALPTWFIFLVIYIVIVYNAWNIINTNRFESYYTIRDTIEVPKTTNEKEIQSFHTTQSIAPADDIPISQINRILFCSTQHPQ
ncbi:hypothetical protein GUITHDRAFT_131792 [Guillardia theta CCMP2712]|uniref:PIG-P domain-containing protein n=1 Tax=Guillardia theta (strain CCMP2712) TaxID=905079 RepID=L1K1U2_GUITC|nr:hypothetical protein GUITHDRAFT_131792 [Guillardia theta CCMP2712]EKX54781.1 hypothetical protein GUITHDRAFT_131792 [Guillardia theta CCMP2712]|eukprot:XP_005841761.1 hypothetical protein GUITHDRAFT_131792 [Guillardia theta CCMP2712]